MSGGPVCHTISHDHVVIARRHNNSAFNGYHRTPSAYSGVLCLQTGMVWRSKARRVDELPDITPKQRNAWMHGEYDAPFVTR